MSICLMKQNFVLLNKMKKTKKKAKEITFQSTRDKHDQVWVSLPFGYRKKKLPGLKAWVDALNSGKYRQGISHLCIKKEGRFKYCCLGVLSKVQGRLVSTKHKTERGDGPSKHDYNVCHLHPSNPVYSILDDLGYFPDDVYVNVFDKRDVDCNDNPEFTHSDANSLVKLNDDLGLSFKDIAKVLQIIFKP